MCSTNSRDDKLKNMLGTWYEYLRDEFDKEYMLNLSKTLQQLYSTKNIYPKPDEIFNAFKYCPYDKTKVVIIGQDPYHTPNTAHGLAFSSKQDETPPSLDNIFTEINRELGIHTFNSNDLTQWSKQGFLLLNAVLTVEEGKPKSHMKYGSNKGIGWENFTDKVIEILNKHNNELIFLLWGNFARSYKDKISDKHIKLEAYHPSPLSAERGFFNCGHFKRIKEKYPDINFNIY